MSYRYPHFIKQNIAPPGAKSIGVYDSTGKKVMNVPLGGLTPPDPKKLYSFGLVSDTHLFYDGAPWINWNPNEKFDNALSYCETTGCSFCIVCGDLTQTGLYLQAVDGDMSTLYMDERQFAKHKEICDKHTIPVYALMGNHESYYEQPITNNLDKMLTYTGKDVLCYTVSQGNDLFILLGQPKDRAVVSDEDFKWFKQTLENNKDKRCFVFVHSYIEEDSGDAKDVRENSIFEDGFWGTKNKIAFMELMKQYTNTVLFHGHSHIKFEYQELDKSANYTDKNGFKSVHIPSLGKPRDVIRNDMGTPNDETDDVYTNDYANDESQGYIVDVYADYIVLNGMDLVHNTPIPLGTYKITT